MNKKRIIEIAGVAAGIIALAAFAVAAKPHAFGAPRQAEAQTGPTGTVVFGMSVYGITQQVTASPSTAPVTWAGPIYTYPSYGYPSDTAHGISLNASSFSTDFRVGLKICETDGINCHTAWTPWAYDVSNNPGSANYSAVAGPGPYDGGFVCGAPTATLHNRLGLTYIAAQTRPLPLGTVLNNVSLSLYPMEWDYNVPVDAPVVSGASCSFWSAVSGATPGTTPLSGGWSNGAFDKWMNASTDGFAITVNANATVYDASFVGTNIPTSATAGATITTGTDGKPLEITMKNTGTFSWPSKAGSAIGPGTGTCDVDTNGGGVLNAPAPTAANAASGASCTVTYNYIGTTDIMSHVVGSTTPNPDPMSYTQQVPISMTWVATTTDLITFLICPSGGGLLTPQQPTTGFNKVINAFIHTAYADYKSLNCTDTQTTSTVNAHYKVKANAPTVVTPGSNATFILKSLTMPSKSGVYTEMWGMNDPSYGAFGSPAPVTINVGNATQPGQITVESENAASTSIPISAKWDLTGQWTMGDSTVCQGVSGLQAYMGDPSGQAVACSGEQQTYQGLSDNNITYDLANETTTAPFYSLKSVDRLPIAQKQHTDLLTLIRSSFGNIFSTVALADNVEVLKSDGTIVSHTWSWTLTPASNTATFIILWTPNAGMAVSSTNPVKLNTVNQTSQTVTVQNTGAPYSTLSWSAAATTSGGGNWLKVSPGGSIQNQQNQQGTSGGTSTITISFDPTVVNKLAAGTYYGTTTISGIDPNRYPRHIGTSTISVALTVDSASTYYTCVDPSTNSCTTTSTNTGFSSCTAACAAVQPTITASCTPTTVAPDGTAQCTETGGKGCTWSVANGGGTINAGGLYTAPGSTGSATIEASCNAGSASSTVPITIAVPQCPAGSNCQPTVSLSATPDSIVIPESTTLTYNVSGAVISGGSGGCTLSGGKFGAGTTVAVDANGNASGSVSDTPSATTSYTLSCENGKYSTNNTATMTVQVTVGGTGRCETNPNGAGCPGQ